MRNLYHVTHTSLAGSIRRKGILCFQMSNWLVAGTRKRYGKGEIYAFEHIADAVRWAGHMEWHHYHKTGSGKVSIVVFTSTALWTIDRNDPMRQAGRKGAWLKSNSPVPPDNIVSIEPVTLTQMREIAKQFFNGW